MLPPAPRGCRGHEPPTEPVHRNPQNQSSARSATPRGKAARRQENSVAPEAPRARATQGNTAPPPRHLLRAPRCSYPVQTLPRTTRGGTHQAGGRIMLLPRRGRARALHNAGRRGGAPAVPCPRGERAARARGTRERREPRGRRVHSRTGGGAVGCVRESASGDDGRKEGGVGQEMKAAARKRAAGFSVGFSWGACLRSWDELGSSVCAYRLPFRPVKATAHTVVHCVISVSC